MAFFIIKYKLNVSICHPILFAAEVHYTFIANSREVLNYTSCLRHVKSKSGTRAIIHFQICEVAQIFALASVFLPLP